MPRDEIILPIKPHPKPQGTPNWGSKAWKEYREWRGEFTAMLIDLKLSFKDLPIPYEVRFFVDKHATYSKKFPGHPRYEMPDLDNYVKAFQDGWFGGFSEIDGIKYNDGAVWAATAQKYHSPIPFIQIVPAIAPTLSEIQEIIKRVTQ
jgi:Holliday junction resolvase RusA-like endonuclease